jgi:hypothetical protein
MPIVLIGLSSTVLGCGGGNGGGGTPLFALTGKAYHEVAGGACCHPPVDTPLASTLLTFHLSSATANAASTQTDASGNFSVRLPAGTYVADLSNRNSEPLYNTVEPSRIIVMPTASNTTDIKFVQDVP